MKKLGIAVLAVLMGLCSGAQAIDRGARMIDTISLDLAELDDADSIGGSLWGETALTMPRQDWAILFGIGYNEISPDFAANIEAWTFGIGLKYYLTSLTSLGGIGTYSDYSQDTTEDKDAKAGTAFLKQRLLPVEDPMSPFLKGAFTWRERSTFSDADPALEGDSFSEVLLHLGGGVEFNMDSDFTFVFEGGYVIADESDDNSEDLDGFFASLGMQYYWF